MTSPVLAEGLGRSFGDLVAVRDVDLEVAHGEVYGFLGPNGAGKSTTVRMLTTLLKPTSGRATVAGHDVVTAADAVRASIGVALQDAAIDPIMTGTELVRLQATLHGIPRQLAASRGAELIERVGLSAAADRRVGTYSGGMRRRLDLAMSLIHEPKVLFLDEPTTGLDPTSRQSLWEEVRRLNGELGTTVFLTTQYLEEADALADRVGIIAKGKMVAEGTPTDLKRSVGKDLVMIDVDAAPGAAISALEGFPGAESIRRDGDTLTVSAEDGAALVGPLVVKLNEAGIGVGALSVRTPTLDDVFLVATGSRLAPDAEVAA